jgi:hypothetical protein
MSAALAAVALLGACHTNGGRAEATPTGTVPPPPPTSVAGPPPPPPAAPQSRTVKWIDLAPGDCLADPPPNDPSVVLVTVVDCAAPHAAEVFLRVPVEVNAAIADVANAKCSAGLSEYAGAPAAGGPYAVAYLIDSNQDRTSTNPLPSTVICLLQAQDARPLNGSARR